MKKLKYDRQMEICRNLSELLSKGVVLSKALKITKAPNEMYERIENGEPIAEVFCDHFSQKISLLVSLGVNSGRLDYMFSIAYQDMKNTKQFRSSLIHSLLYPLIVLSASFVSIVFFMIYVLPHMITLYSALGIRPSAHTVFMINVLKTSLLCLPMTVILFAVIFYWSRKNIKFRDVFISIPVIGNILRSMIIHEVSTSMHVLLSSGMSFSNALSCIIETTKDNNVKNALERARTNIESGVGVSDSFAGEKIFGQDLVMMLRIGEDCGSIDSAFEQAGERYGQICIEWMKNVSIIIEPVSTIFVGSVVGGMAFMMFLPLVDAMNRI